MILGWILRDPIEGLSQPNIRFQFQHVEESHRIGNSGEEISPLGLDAFFPPKIDIRGSKIIEERGFEKGLGLGIKTDLWKFLNRLSIRLSFQIVIHHSLSQETELIPVLSPEDI